MFKMSPQQLVRGGLKFGFEKFNKTGTSSIQFYTEGLMNNQRDIFAWYNSYLGYNGINLECMIKKYLIPIQEFTNRKGGKYTQGIYLGGFIQGGLYSGEFVGEEIDRDPITNVRTSTPYAYEAKPRNAAAGFTIGVQRLFWKVLAIDAYMGAGFQIAKQNIEGSPASWANKAYNFSDATYRGVIPKFGLVVGLIL